MQEHTCGQRPHRFRAKIGLLQTFQGLLPESQGQNLALTVLFVIFARQRHPECVAACVQALNTAMAEAVTRMRGDGDGDGDGDGKMDGSLLQFNARHALQAFQELKDSEGGV